MIVRPVVGVNGGLLGLVTWTSGRSAAENELQFDLKTFKVARQTLERLRCMRRFEFGRAYGVKIR